MLSKNTTIFIPHKSQHMKKLVYKTGLACITTCCMLLVLSSCSKSKIEAIQQSQAEQQFESNILNKNFRVHLAMDNGADLTSQYTGYTFVLYKSTYYNGPMTAVKNAVTYSGTWSCNDDYSKLTITFPSTPSEFIFLNRDWKFTKKALPIMELAPWGTTEPKILHMEQF